jgi:hypothetical protein
MILVCVCGIGLTNAAAAELAALLPILSHNKVKILFWLFNKDRLSTCDRLFSPPCPLCDGATEDRLHAFV